MACKTVDEYDGQQFVAVEGTHFDDAVVNVLGHTQGVVHRTMRVELHVEGLADKVDLRV
jgi:hypothetical protein